MPNLLDANGFPDPGKPVLQNQKEDIRVRRATVEGLNPALGTGYLFHTTGTGALSAVGSVVTSVAAGDIYTTISPTTGAVGIYINTSALAGVFVPYTGAVTDVNSIYSYISTDPVTTGTASEFPSSAIFTTANPNITLVNFCDSSGGQLFDSFSDGFLYDGGFAQQATINYATGAVDTTAYNSYIITQIDYTYTLAFIPTTTISYGGSTFSNGIVVSKNAAGYAGYFGDGTSIVTLLDGARAGYFYDGTNEAILGNTTYAIEALGRTKLTGGLTLNYSAQTATYGINTNDYTIECTANTFTVTLPTAGGVAGQVYNVKNTGTGTITVDTTTSETIDGALTVTLAQWENLTVQSNGANWIIL